MSKPSSKTKKTESSDEQLEIVIFVGALPMLIAVGLHHFFGWNGFCYFFFGSNLLLWLACGVNKNEPQCLEESDE